MSVDELRSHYPELASERIVAPDVIDDGQRLGTFDDGAVDFVVASHFIEHCEDPIGALRNQLRVLKPSGILFLAVPEMRQTIDHARPVTSIEHLVKDHRDGGRASRLDHYREWATMVSVPLGSVPADQAEQHAHELAARDYSIHFHVWTLGAFDQLLRFCRSTVDLPFEVIELAPNHHEFIAVLRRTPGEG
jgi:SAM-dependent methyltransferase